MKKATEIEKKRDRIHEKKEEKTNQTYNILWREILVICYLCAVCSGSV